MRIALRRAMFATTMALRFLLGALFVSRFAALGSSLAWARWGPVAMSLVYASAG